MSSIKMIACFILSFLLAMVISPLVLHFLKIIGVKQTTLSYVEKHGYKSGTPTMGGLIFLIPMVIIGLIYCYNFTSIGSIAIFVTIAYGIVGFLDDFLKVKRSQNLGLKAYQKIIMQILISFIVSYYAYKNPFILGETYIPFTKTIISMKWYYIPLAMLVFIATTNAVNLTDGLDGLATKTSIAYFVSFMLILIISLYKTMPLDNFKTREILSLIYFVSALLGGLFAFLWQNAYPAKLFMGDTGSLSLGGAVASIAVFSKNIFLLPLIGIMYVVTCISVIMQVICYKLTKKRIFKMAPLHHHLEYKGIKESKIVTYYTIITIICGAVAVYSFLI